MMTSYKTIFNILNGESEGPYENPCLFVEKKTEFGMLKINTDKICTIREDLICDVVIGTEIFVDFISYMIKRKNVLFEKIITNESLCEKLIKEGKIKSFRMNSNYVAIENIEIKEISMVNGNLYIIPLFN